MKRIFLAVVMLSFFATSFAQDLSDGLKAKNAGNEAYRNKNYVEAIENWESYFNSGEEGADTDANTKKLYRKSFKYAATDFMKSKNYSKAYDYFKQYREKAGEEAKADGKTAYYMAYCSNKMDNDDSALSHYQEAVELGYREDVSMLYMANIYKKNDNEEKMISILKKALEEHPNSKYRSKMLDMLTIPMLKVAAVPFNKANELAKAASTGDPNNYIANMAKAVDKFKEARPLFNEVLKIDPKNEQAKTYIDACNDNIKSFNDYKASLDK